MAALHRLAVLIVLSATMRLALSVVSGAAKPETTPMAALHRLAVLTVLSATMRLALSVVSGAAKLDF
jgi:hypothetical protein